MDPHLTVLLSTSERAVQEMRRQGVSSTSVHVSGFTRHISPEHSILRIANHSTERTADR